MRVGVQGHGDSGMTEEFLHDLGVYAPAQEQRGARMPEVVEADLREPCPLQKRLEGTLYEVLRI